MTRDEFGIDLFKAVGLQAARGPCLKNVGRYRHKGLVALATEEETKAARFEAELVTLFEKETIQPSDVKRLLAMAG